MGAPGAAEGHGGAVPTAVRPPPHAAVLLVSARPDLVEHVREVVAAAGVALTEVARPADAGAAWDRASLVLLGEDAAGMPVPTPRHDVVLVTGGGDPQAWALAAAVGASRVLVLPDARGQLLEQLAGLAPPGARGRVVGVIGGRGGAGASTLALAAGLAAVWLGRRAVLVDADPLGGGIDVLAGAETVPGYRWPDLGTARGAVRPEVLQDGLPEVDGLGLLSWDRSRSATSGVVEVDSARVVLTAAAAGHDLVVVDLRRGSGPSDTALWRLLDAVVVVVPGEVRACLAAARLLDQVHEAVAAVHLVVRQRRPSQVSVTAVADALELPVSAVWPDDPQLPTAAERSDVVATLWRRRHRGPCEQLLAELVGGGADLSPRAARGRGTPTGAGAHR